MTEESKAIVKAVEDHQIEMGDLIGEVVDKLDRIIKLLEHIAAKS
ncbi:MAG: hypothetical protein ABID87_03670 [Chloroflexota bacterium]